jgi:hypothetical protein
MKKIITIMIALFATVFFAYHIIAIQEYSDIEFKLENTSIILEESYINFISPVERRNFIKQIKKPTWFNDKPSKIVNNIKEAQELWSSKKRCCVDANILLENNREFFRACYNGVTNNINNDELVVKCIYLMSATENEKNKRYIMNNYIVKNYFEHKNDISRCANCNTGDTITRTVKKLAQAEYSLGNKSKAISLLENVITNRKDAAYWIQVETLEQLGRLYLKNKLSFEQITFINDNFDNLLKESKNNEAATKRIPKLQKLIDKINMQ